MRHHFKIHIEFKTQQILTIPKRMPNTLNFVRKDFHRGGNITSIPLLLNTNIQSAMWYHTIVWCHPGVHQTEETFGVQEQHLHHLPDCVAT
jgi:hypothetical protein